MTRQFPVASVISRPLRSALAVALLATAGFAGVASATTYRIVEMPLPPGDSDGAAKGINSAGDVVGSVTGYLPGTGNSYDFAVVWSAPDYSVRALSPRISYAADEINDAGYIIGNVFFPGSASDEGVMWKPDGTLVRLDHLRSGPTNIEALGINADGTIVGYVWGGYFNWPAVWEDSSQRPRVLRPPSPGLGDGGASAVNDLGVVVGAVNFGGLTDFYYHAFRWTLAGGMQDLGDLPGGDDYSEAHDVNEIGQIVGSGRSETGRRVVMWDTNGPILDLGVLPDGEGLYYNQIRINNAGEVIGTAYDPGTGRSQGFMWAAGSGIVRIADLIDPLDPWYQELQDGTASIDVYGLNDAGVIVGHLLPDPPSHAGEVPIMLAPQP